MKTGVVFDSFITGMSAIHRSVQLLDPHFDSRFCQTCKERKIRLSVNVLSRKGLACNTNTTMAIESSLLSGELKL